MQTAKFCIFLFEVCFASMHNKGYVHVSLHLFLFFNMKNEVTLFIVVELKRSFFFVFREVGSSDTCIAPVQVQIRK